MMRQPNGPGVSSVGGGVQHQPQFNGPSPMLPTKSPMVTHKPLHPPGPSPSTPNSNQGVSSVSSSNLKCNLNGNGDSTSVGLDKVKDSTKMFPTKTYNHIKDMISSRFGNGNSTTGLQQQSKGLNNSNVVNNNAANSSNAITNNISNNATPNGGNFNGLNGQNGGNSYMDAAMGITPMPSYGVNQHGHLHSHSIHDSYGGGSGPPQYFTGPPTISPPNGNGANSGNQQPQPVLNGSANSYRSPPMNDRKNVNTSFRKAIHQSTMKSNLTEESLQLRPIMETSNMNTGNNRDVYRSMQYPQQNGEQSQQQQRYGLGHEPPSPSLIPHHVERAQRALDKLCESGGPGFTRTGSGPMTQQNGISRMVQQFSGSVGNNSQANNAEEHSRPMYSLNGKIGAMSPSSAAAASASQLSAGGELGAIPRNRFTVTSGPSSSASNSSGGLSTPITTAGLNAMITVESSLSSPSSYMHNNKQTLAHQAPTTSLPNGNSSNHNSNNKSNHLTITSNTNNSNGGNSNDQAPPPLPTSQKPEVSGASGHSSTAGLSHHHFLSSNGSGGNNSSHHNTLGLPPVLPSVLAGEKRENGDGTETLHLESSSPSQGAATIMNGVATGASNASSSALALNKSKSEQLKKITADLHNLAISVAAEQHFHNHHHSQFASGSGSASSGGGNNNQNNSSSSECENKGSQRIGSGQSHTTSDSGVGTVMLTKSPLHSISDHESGSKVGGGGGAADMLLGGDERKFGENVMDSVSSGNFHFLNPSHLQVYFLNFSFPKEAIFKCLTNFANFLVGFPYLNANNIQNVVLNPFR